MVYTDPVSQEADALRRLSDYHQLPIVSVHAPNRDPTALDVPNVTLDLSHTAASGSNALIMATELDSRLAHVHLADGAGSGGAVPDEHLVPGRGGQPCAELLGLLPGSGYPGA